MDVKRHASFVAEMAAQLITAEPDSAVSPKDVLDAAHLKADLEVLKVWQETSAAQQIQRRASRRQAVCVPSTPDRRFVAGGTSGDALRPHSRRVISPCLAVDASGRLG